VISTLTPTSKEFTTMMVRESSTVFVNLLNTTQTLPLPRLIPQRTLLPLPLPQLALTLPDPDLQKLLILRPHRPRLARESVVTLRMLSKQSTLQRRLRARGRKFSKSTEIRKKGYNAKQGRRRSDGRMKWHERQREGRRERVRRKLKKNERRGNRRNRRGKGKEWRKRE